MSEVDRIKGRWAKADDAELDSAVNALLGARNGRRFLWWLLSIGKVGGQPFSPDAAVTAFACGELNVGNQIQARLMMTNPEGYTLMQQEMLNERRDRDRELNAASDLDRGSGAAFDPDNWERDPSGE
jgi:hypothetical protein